MCLNLYYGLRQLLHWLQQCTAILRKRELKIFIRVETMHVNIMSRQAVMGHVAAFVQKVKSASGVVGQIQNAVVDW